MQVRILLVDENEETDERNLKVISIVDTTEFGDEYGYAEVFKLLETMYINHKKSNIMYRQIPVMHLELNEKGIVDTDGSVYTIEDVTLVLPSIKLLEEERTLPYIAVYVRESGY